MLDLDKYINNSIQIHVFGKDLDVLEPTMEMVMKVDAIESDMTHENVHDKRVEMAYLFLNYNKQCIEIKKEEIWKLPLEAVSRLIAEISVLRYEADHDPNSESQSQKEK